MLVAGQRNVKFFITQFVRVSDDFSNGVSWTTKQLHNNIFLFKIYAEKLCVSEPSINFCSSGLKEKTSILCMLRVASDLSKH